MAKKTLTIINRLGLHARAAARFVQVASGFESEISVVHATKEVNGKSIMGMMMLAAGKGSDIQIIATGRDEETALEQLESLVADRFGESE